MKPRNWRLVIQILLVVGALGSGVNAWSAACPGYTGNDECCDTDDPCNKGFDLSCYSECAVCGWEAADCNGSPDPYPYIRVFEVGDEVEDWGVGATCTVVDEDGDPVYPPIQVTAGAYGVCQFEGVTSGYSVRVSRAGFHDSYLFNMIVEQIHVIPYYSEDLIEAVFGPLDPGTGVIFGHVLWGYFDDITDYLFEPVGCAGLTGVSADAYYYFDGEGYPTTNRSTTNPLNSGYLVFGAEDGPFTLTSTVDGDDDEVEMASSEVIPFRIPLRISRSIIGGRNTQRIPHRSDANDEARAESDHHSAKNTPGDLSRRVSEGAVRTLPDGSFHRTAPISDEWREFCS